MDTTKCARSDVDKLNVLPSSVIYFAGGCFWGLEQYFVGMPWVLHTEVGYATGTPQVKPGTVTYQTAMARGFAEAVEVVWNSNALSLHTLVERFLHVIDPYSLNQQGADKGTQYRTGIYYTSDTQSAAPTNSLSNQIRSQLPPDSVVEVLPLEQYYTAEEYHQRYLTKNSNGYCHIPRPKLEQTWPLIDKHLYPRPSDAVLREKLNTLQYNVTQKNATERPFSSPLAQDFQRGIYVDIVTGEPLFASSAQFNAGCGWPSFSRPLDHSLIDEFPDNSAGHTRTEVRSANGNSHLGHVFDDGPSADQGGTGLRYCINAASLRFVHFDEMDSQEYGYLKDLV
jgi:peptide methionine sulfoxide reductase msrA/msrB